jgi:exodeoxyribonuclease V gamma subunit
MARIIDQMILTRPADESEHRAVREGLEALGDRVAAAGFEERVSFAAFKGFLVGALEDLRGKSGWRPHGVTFSRLVSMRHIPAKVVALIGMNDREFPRTRQAPSFDLMAEAPRIGDRSVASDDRAEFLAAVLAARDLLVITYMGQSIRDGSPIPPSVVVSELADTLVSTYGLKPDALVCPHPLQPFSPRYFRTGGDPRLFSYDAGAFAGARAMASPDKRPWVFFPSPLARDEAPQVVDIADLALFFGAPAEYLMRHRLLAVFERAAKKVPAREPLSRDVVETWAACDRLLEAGMAGEAPDALLPVLSAVGLLPPGPLGPERFKWFARQVAPLVQEAGPLVSGPVLEPLALDLPVETATGRARIVGCIGDICENARVAYGFYRIDGRRLLQLWIHHLALLAQDAPGYPQKSVLIGRKDRAACDKAVLGAVTGDVAAHLADLVDLYLAGTTQPLPLVPSVSHEYARALLSGKSEDAALLAASARMKQSSESTSPAFRTVFRGVEPTAGTLPGGLDFHGVATRVFTPLLEAIRQGRRA